VKIISFHYRVWADHWFGTLVKIKPSLSQVHAMTVTLAKWTIEDYHQIIETGVLADRNVELLYGEIVEMPSEGVGHAYLNTRGRNIFQKLLGDRAEIRDAKPVTLPEHASEPAPDVAVVQSPDDIYATHHPYPENIFLLVEYSYSSLAKDKELKRLLYAKAGIIEYWIVNLVDRRVDRCQSIAIRRHDQFTSQRNFG
jgi:Uma2 family endonuclease